MSSNTKAQRGRREIFYYDPKTSIARLVIRSIIYAVFLYIVLGIIKRCFDITPWTQGYIQRGYWSLLAIYVVGSIISIQCKMQKRLKISDTEVHYIYGVLDRRKVSIPVSKVSSCEIGKSILQKFLGTSTLSVSTAGDDYEIFFEDMKRGEDAYHIIMEMIQ